LLTALVLGSGFRSALVAWLVICLVIAGLWLVRGWPQAGQSLG
jgi:hypothetical protein